MVSTHIAGSDVPTAPGPASSRRHLSARPSPNSHAPCAFTPYEPDRRWRSMAKTTTTIRFREIGPSQRTKSAFDGSSRSTNCSSMATYSARSSAAASFRHLILPPKPISCAFKRVPFEALLEAYPKLERQSCLNLLNDLGQARDWMPILFGQKFRAAAG